MKSKRTHRTLPEKMQNANVFSDGALFNIPYIDVITKKLEFYSKKRK